MVERGELMVVFWGLKNTPLIRDLFFGDSRFGNGGVVKSGAAIY